MWPAPAFLPRKKSVESVDDRWRVQYVVAHSTLDVIDGTLKRQTLSDIITAAKMIGDTKIALALGDLERDYDHTAYRGIRGLVIRKAKQADRYYLPLL